MNEAPFSISVFDPQGKFLGEEAIADYNTFRFYERLFLGREFYREYTVHFVGQDGEDQYFKLADVVSASKPYPEEIPSATIPGGRIVSQAPQNEPKSQHIDVRVKKAERFNLPSGTD